MSDLSALDAEAWREIVLVALTWAALVVAARCLYVMLRNSWEKREQDQLVASFAPEFLPLSEGLMHELVDDYDLVATEFFTDMGKNQRPSTDELLTPITPELASCLASRHWLSGDPL